MNHNETLTVEQIKEMAQKLPHPVQTDVWFYEIPYLLPILGEESHFAKVIFIRDQWSFPREINRYRENEDYEFGWIYDGMTADGRVTLIFRIETSPEQVKLWEAEGEISRLKRERDELEKKIPAEKKPSWWERIWK